MSLRDLGQMLCAGWRQILGGLLISFITASLYFAMTPNQYEATLLVRVGQVGVAGVAKGEQVGMGVWSRQIEGSVDVIARMQTIEFQNAVVESLGWKGDDRAQLLNNSYQIPSPTLNHLKIRVRGLTSSDARQAVSASLAVLVDIHNGLSERIVAQRDRELSKVQSDIADSEAFLRNIDGLGQGGTQSRSELATANWLKVIKDEKSRLRELHTQQIALKEAMSPELNKPTMAVEPAIVSDKPVYPNARRVWLFATVAGLLFGVLLVTLSSINRMNRNPTRSDQ